jgi:hypothetical protein
MDTHRCKSKNLASIVKNLLTFKKAILLLLFHDSVRKRTLFVSPAYTFSWIPFLITMLNPLKTTMVCFLINMMMNA